MSIQRDELLKRLRSVRRDLLKQIDDVDMQAVLDENGGRLQDWLAYIAIWDREVLAAVQAVLEGDMGYRTANFDTWEAWSSREIARRATWPAEQIRTDFAMVRLELLALLSQLDAAFFTREFDTPWDHTRMSIAEMIERMSIAHDRELLDLLRQYKRQSRNGH